MFAFERSEHLTPFNHDNQKKTPQRGGLEQGPVAGRQDAFHDQGRSVSDRNFCLGRKLPRSGAAHSGHRHGAPGLRSAQSQGSGCVLRERPDTGKAAHAAEKNQQACGTRADAGYATGVGDLAGKIGQKPRCVSIHSHQNLQRCEADYPDAPKPVGEDMGGVARLSARGLRLPFTAAHPWGGNVRWGRACCRYFQDVWSRLRGVHAALFGDHPTTSDRNVFAVRSENRLHGHSDKEAGKTAKIGGTTTPTNPTIMPRHGKNILGWLGLLTGQITPKSNLFCQENLTKIGISLQNRDTYLPLSKMGKLDKSALAGALMMGAAIAAPAQAEQSNLDMLTDPALTEQMIRDSGFMIPDAGEGAVIGIPIGNGKYQIVGRFYIPPEAIADAPLAAGSTQLIQPGGNGQACQVFQHDDPAKRVDVGENSAEGLYDPQQVCSYRVTLSDEQIEALANGQMRVNQFFPSISGTYTIASAEGDPTEFDVIPAVGGREITDPIQVSTYNLDAQINRELHLNTAKVWLACWNTQNMSIGADGDTTPFDVPGLTALQELQKCTDAKAAAESRMGDVRVAISEAQLETAQADRIAAEADRDAARSDRESAERDAQTLTEILNILRRNE